MHGLQRIFSKRRITTLLFFVVVTMAVVGGIRAIPHERLLLERATPVSSVSGTDDSDAMLQIRDDYYWIAVDKLLYFRGYWEPGHLELWERDLSTGKNRRLPGLTQLFNRSFVRHTEQVVSPDGRYLIWYGTDGEFHMCTLDGSSHSQWAVYPSDEINPLCWRADSKEVVELVNAHNRDQLQLAILTDVKDVHRRKTIRFPANTLLSAEADRFVFGPDQTLTAARIFYDPKLPAAIVVDLKTGSEKPIYLHFPESVTWAERTGMLSPDGKRIAWEVIYTIYDQPWAFLHRYFSSVPITKHRYQAIWISRTDGNSTEEIGRVPVSNDQEAIENLDVKWLPDNRRISFVYGDTLWTISADL